MGSIPEDEETVSLSIGAAEGEEQPQYRAFAQLILEHLHSAGLPAIDMLRRAPEESAGAPAPDPEPGPYDPNLCKFTLENGQTVFVHFDAGRSWYGHKEIAVLTRQQAQETLTASRVERAIVAATTAMQFGIIDAQVGAIDTRRLRRALAHIDGPLAKSAEEHRRTTVEQMWKTGERSNSQQRKQNNQRALVEFQVNLQTPSLEYVLALLRYSRPNFDVLPRQEQVGLILQTCERINKFLKSLRELTSFLEYGTPEGLSNKPVTQISRNVQAAILSEIVGLSHREIGEKLGLEIPASSKTKGGHATVSRAIERGLAFLEDLLGKEGWREQRGSMKAEAERYNALSKEERHIEDLAERWGVSKEEARKRHEREQPRYPDIPTGLSGIPEEELLDRMRNLEEESP